MKTLLGIALLLWIGVASASANEARPGTCHEHAPVNQDGYVYTPIHCAPGIDAYEREPATVRLIAIKSECSIGHLGVVECFGLELAYSTSNADGEGSRGPPSARASFITLVESFLHVRL